MRSPETLNRLSREKSPYLLQHAANPVDWYPWSAEAFEKARREDKPVFLSIGYSTCHWCHVMEGESFENEMIAKYLNDHFISIKVDREERPDVDQIYMAAVQAMTGQGGWPLTVFLTPDREPFFGGTYFPPYAKWGSPGFFDVLASIQHGWSNEREKMLKAGNALTGMLREHLPGRPGQEALTDDILRRAYEEFRQSYDPPHGGFGTAPKFPTSHNLSFLLRYARRDPDSDARDMAALTLRRMAEGGMYDHLGGGFHRYSTDREWQIPHFEKMLYDQAILGRTYTEMYQLTGDDFYARVARETFDYCLRDLRDAGGAFHSAEDADSLDPYEFSGTAPDSAQKLEKKEGAFFLWRAAHIDEVLDKADADIFKCLYGILPDGNAKVDPHGEFGGRNVLAQARTAKECAAELGVSVADVAASLQRARTALFALREQRPRPHLDDKVLVDWNGLLIGAMAYAGRVLQEQRYVTAAEEAAGFILTNMITDGRLLHRYRDGDAAIEGMLEDYAFFVNALIDLYEATFDPLYIEKAVALQTVTDELFADAANGGYFLTPAGAADLIYRPKEIYDGAIPSGNSMAALALIRLYHITFNKKYLDRAQELFTGFAANIRQRPSAHSQMLMAFDFAVGPAAEIVIAGPRGDAGVRDFSDSVFRAFLPNRVLLHRDGDPQKGKALWVLAPFLEKQPPVEDKPTVYVCENGVCQRPVTDLTELDTILKKMAKKE